MMTKSTKPVTLITAAEARNMREQSIIDFNQKGMTKVIEHLNKKIEARTAKGHWGIDILYKPYMELDHDKVLGELSDTQIDEVIKHLKDNGYQAFINYQVLYINWNEPKVEIIQHEKIFKDPWYCFWRHS